MKRKKINRNLVEFIRENEANVRTHGDTNGQLSTR